MAVSIAEYLGQRTDANQNIVPHDFLEPDQRAYSPLCPFNGHPCAKMSKRRNPKPPVCSLRKTSGQFYIVCEHRLISTTTGKITSYQQQMLLQAAKVLFGDHVEPQDVGFKTEVRVQSNANSRNAGKADFVIAVLDDNQHTIGPRRFITEVQGGGETSETGSITSHLSNWSKLREPNNAFLRETTKAGTIETNAWRRFQEQLLSKGKTATKTNSDFGFAALIGETIFDYVARMLPEIRSLDRNPENDKWDTALIVYSEVATYAETRPLVPIDLKIDKNKSTFLLLDELLNMMIKRGRSDTAAFSGEYTALTGDIVRLD